MEWNNLIGLFIHFNPNDSDSSLFKNENDIDQCIEYGIRTSSIENFLQYDVIDDLIVSFNLYQEAKCGPF